MNKSFKCLAVLLITAVFLVWCQGQKDSFEGEKENVAHENPVKEKVDKEKKDKENIAEKDSNEISSNQIENLKHIKGAKIGSLSSYVEDREVWDDLFAKRFLDSAERYGLGIHVPRILLDSSDAKIANKEIDSLVGKIKNTYEDNKDNMEGSDIGIRASFSV